jgi:excisionase family DNA binding protein
MCEEGDMLALTVAETARRLGLSRQGAYQAVRRGDIPSLRIGKRILVPRTALEQLLQGARCQDGKERSAGE